MERAELHKIMTMFETACDTSGLYVYGLGRCVNCEWMIYQDETPELVAGNYIASCAYPMRDDDDDDDDYEDDYEDDYAWSQASNAEPTCPVTGIDLRSLLFGINLSDINNFLEPTIQYVAELSGGKREYSFQVHGSLLRGNRGPGDHTTDYTKQKI